VVLHSARDSHRHVIGSPPTKQHQLGELAWRVDRNVASVANAACAACSPRGGSRLLVPSDRVRPSDRARNGHGAWPGRGTDPIAEHRARRRLGSSGSAAHHVVTPQAPLMRTGAERMLSGRVGGSEVRALCRAGTSRHSSRHSKCWIATVRAWPATTVCAWGARTSLQVRSCRSEAHRELQVVDADSSRVRAGGSRGDSDARVHRGVARYLPGPDAGWGHRLTLRTSVAAFGQ
jgi:hypothetical protein